MHHTPAKSAMPAMIAFDLDDTLAPSKSPIDSAMAVLLYRLLGRAAVCIISGGRFEQFRDQVLSALPTTDRLSDLHIMPTCGTRYHRWDGEKWALQYAEDLTAEEKQRVVAVLSAGAQELGLAEAQTWGPVIEDRGSQITFSALGQQAPVDAKQRWDPSGIKRERLRSYAAARLPDLEVRSGGSTSVDVTRLGIDKAYGIRRLCEHNDLTLSDLLFVGDRLDPGGNDYPVRALGVPCLAVSCWEDTRRWLEAVLAGAGVLGTSRAAHRRLPLPNRYHVRELFTSPRLTPTGNMTVLAPQAGDWPSNHRDPHSAQ
jgi:HAD superfamily hydrolase (TIGR01484 family)